MFLGTCLHLVQVYRTTSRWELPSLGSPSGRHINTCIKCTINTFYADGATGIGF